MPVNPEINAYLDRLDDLRGQVSKLIAGLPAEALNWRPTEEVADHATNSLAVLAAHVAGAEHFWIAEVIGRQPATRDRPAEFVTVVDNPESLLAQLAAVGRETRQVLTDLPAAELETSRSAHERTVPVRWAILHIIEHFALHLGHMQLTYQLYDGGRGADMPRWFQRLNS